MIPIVGLSVVAMAYALERAVFWFRLLRDEKRVARTVLETARFDLRAAETIAAKAQDSAIGRFLLAPLKLRNATPEAFHRALDTAADQEFATMRRGDQLFETVIGLAPLLGLLGTVASLMQTFRNADFGGENADLNPIAARIGEALIPTVSGLLVAVLALIVYRILVFLQANQINYFARVGSELELIHRQVWYEPSQQLSAIASDNLSSTSESLKGRS